MSQLGRCVRIAHQGTLASSYGHLARIALGVGEGTAVERGQVIGYVGASGLATGPHLHFAMQRDGRSVDPLALTAAPPARIARQMRPAFERTRATVTRELETLAPTLDHARLLAAVGFPAE